MEISKWCSEAGCLCRNLSFSCSENDEIMFLSDEVVLGKGVIVFGSEGIRLVMGGMVSGSEEMKEADFVSASCRLASGICNFNK